MTPNADALATILAALKCWIYDTSYRSWDKRREEADAALAYVNTLAAGQERIAYLDLELHQAATYKGIEGYPCPLCKYDNGVFIERCQMHTDMDEMMVEINRLRKLLGLSPAYALTVDDLEPMNKAMSAAPQAGAAVMPIPTADWANAPQWAMWYSVSAEGHSWWHQAKPEEDQMGFVGGWKGEYAGNVYPDWRLSLQKRPEK